MQKTARKTRVFLLEFRALLSLRPSVIKLLGGNKFRLRQGFRLWVKTLAPRKSAAHRVGPVCSKQLFCRIEAKQSPVAAIAAGLFLIEKTTGGKRRTTFSSTAGYGVCGNDTCALFGPGQITEVEIDRIFGDTQQFRRTHHAVLQAEDPLFVEF